MMRTWLPSLAATRGLGTGLAAEDVGRMAVLSLFVNNYRKPPSVRPRELYVLLLLFESTWAGYINKVYRSHSVSAQARVPPIHYDTQNSVVPSMNRLTMPALSPSQKALLRQTLQGARQAPPPGARSWCLGEMPLGWLAAGHDDALAQALEGTALRGGQRIWQAADWPVAQRSQALQSAAQRLHAQGLIRDWRDELYCYWGDTGGQPHPGLPEHFRLERAAFRFLGLRSHAVHINGFTPDGRMWCGRRALSKATDPGRLDNLAAGGLPAGETVQDCALRELYEEAGLPESLTRQVQPAGHLTTARMEAEGWHEETLLVFNLQIPPDVQPHNTDGEVSGFECLSLDEVMQRIAARDFSEDAACVVAQGLLHF